MLKKVQAITGIIFFVFVVMHLLNTYAAALGPQAYDGLQDVLRQVYQNLLIEAVLLGALVVHITVGVIRIVKEPKRELTSRAKWHRYSGFFLAIFIGGHIFAVRGPSWWLDIYPGFAGLAFSIDYVPAYFFPYYFLLAVAGFYHAANGIATATNRVGIRLTLSTKTLVATTSVAAVLTVAALLGFYGAWVDIGDPYQSDFARLALEIVDDIAP